MGRVGTLNKYYDYRKIKASRCLTSAPGHKNAKKVLVKQNLCGQTEMIPTKFEKWYLKKDGSIHVRMD